MTDFTEEVIEQLKDKLSHLAETTSCKHLVKVIKNRHPDLVEIIELSYGSKFTEKMHKFLYNEPHICPIGNHYKFKSFVDGYKRCNKSGKCKCASAIVGEKVSADKQSYSPERKQEINEKRKVTNLRDYNVANIGQTEKAKQSRIEFYSDDEKVAGATAKNKATKLLNHGNENYNNMEQTLKTRAEKYGPQYWADKYNNQNYLTLYDIVAMEFLVNNYTIPQISGLLQVTTATVCRHLNRLKLRSPFQSSEELGVVRFLESLGITSIIRNSRKLLGNRKEIDIFLPDLKIAIEYNGVFWHHTDVPHITESYHYDKFKVSEDRGIKLISLFSSVWKAKREQVQLELINSLGLNTLIVDSSDCDIRIVSNQDATDFHSLFNVLGAIDSEISYGLFHSGMLVSVMSFNIDDGVVIISLYSYHTNVIGGTKRLLNEFVSTFNPTKMIAYTENEWMMGDVYKDAGFILDETLNPVCWYLSDRSEELYTEVVDELVDTEDEETGELVKRSKFMKVWSCGRRKWVLDI